MRLPTRLPHTSALTQLDACQPIQTQLSEHVWHCMSPDFIQHSLETSLANLNVAHIDVLFLSNPEVFARVLFKCKLPDTSSDRPLAV